MNPSNLLLSLDFGGTKLSAAVVERAALLDERPAWRELRRVYTPAGAATSFSNETSSFHILTRYGILGRDTIRQ